MEGDKVKVGDSDAPLVVEELRYKYGEREALRGVSLAVEPGEAFALLGPNGSGKTTLFRLLATLLPLQGGRASVFGNELATDPAGVRAQLGVVFQSPSLDKKLSVAENLRYNGKLYGLGGSDLADRMQRELDRFRLSDRRDDRVETLSGGLARRVELAQCMLHKPRLLLLDEPSTGLDPAARNDLWERLGEARAEGVTVVVTTHLLDEAARCDRLAILNEGELVALDTPSALQATVGGDTLTLKADEPEQLAAAINDRFQADAKLVEGAVRIETKAAGQLVPELYLHFRSEINELVLGKPTLEDVFLARTGRTFYEAEVAADISA